MATRSPAVRHVFVLMLENRSFDHMFACSGLPGISVATAINSNPLPGGAPISFAGGAPDVMMTDPGHEFGDVVEQLCGPGVTFPASHLYPMITGQGYVANYVKTFKTPSPARTDVAQIMAGVSSSVHAPAIQALAANFVICDRWYASLPGPTWPNRFFMHGASSAGLEHSPTSSDIAVWESVSGFRYPNGSIYDHLGSGNWRLYQDKTGPISGQIPQVASLHGVHGSDVHDLQSFAADLASGYTFPYTFIEPAYGDIVGNSYQRGSSQHPRDGLAGGDRLVAKVYNALRQSPIWRESLLIVTYDEHGGFYDHVAPPAAPAPNDNASSKHNKSGFGFDRYGVRVPSIIVSPWVAKGGVDRAVRDHASVAATLTSLFGMSSLTARDRRGGASLAALFTPSPRADADCPLSIAGAVGESAAPPAHAATLQLAPKAVEPVPEGSNLQAFLFVLRKAHAEAVAGAPSQQPSAARFSGLPHRSVNMTIGQAQAYIEQMAPLLLGAKRVDTP